MQRDLAERQILIDRQLNERQLLHRQIRDHEKRLENDLAAFQERPKPRPERSEAIHAADGRPRLDVLAGRVI